MKFPLGCRVYMKYEQTSCLSWVTPILRIPYYSYVSISRAREISSRFPTRLFTKGILNLHFKLRISSAKGIWGGCNPTLSQGATAAEETDLGIVTWPSVPASKRAEERWQGFDCVVQSRLDLLPSLGSQPPHWQVWIRDFLYVLCLWCPA